MIDTVTFSSINELRRHRTKSLSNGPKMNPYMDGKKDTPTKIRKTTNIYIVKRACKKIWENYVLEGKSQWEEKLEKAI